eukprot:s6741_g3.t1
MDLAVRQVALGAYHSACVCEDGSLWTWGDSGCNQAFDCLKAQHTLVLTTDGHLYATGKGDFGRLGRGDTSDEIDFHEIDYFEHTNDSILSPGEEAKIVKIGAGQNFSAAMSQQGELWVWGRNDYGQLGLGEEAMGDMYSAEPWHDLRLPFVVLLACGGLPEGVRDDNGQERFPRLVRSLPSEGHRIVDFACGEHHVVVLTSDGVLFEWGDRTWLEPHRVSPPQVRDYPHESSGCMVLGAEGPKNVVEPTQISSEVFQHHKLLDVAAAKGRTMLIGDDGGSGGDATDAKMMTTQAEGDDDDDDGRRSC